MSNVTASTDCSEVDCDRAPVARGLCGRHYQHAKKYDRLPPVVRNDSCSGPPVAHGMCGKHYRRAVKAGTLTPREMRPRGMSTVCEESGCNRRPHAQGLCGPHYRKHQGYRSQPTTPAGNALKTLANGGMLGPPASSPYRVLVRTCLTCEELITTPDHLLRKDAGPLPRCRSCYLKARTGPRPRLTERKSAAGAPNGAQVLNSNSKNNWIYLPPTARGRTILARTCHSCGHLLAPSDYFGKSLECSRCHLRGEREEREEQAGIERSLFHPGAVLVAATCTDCQRLLPGHQFYDRRPGACKVCVRALSTGQNRATRATASRNGMEWTSAEMEVVSRRDMTAVQVARMLGRTKSAVQMRRYLIRTDPRAETLVGQVYEVAQERAEHLSELVALSPEEPG